MCSFLSSPIVVDFVALKLSEFWEKQAKENSEFALKLNNFDFYTKESWKYSTKSQPWGLTLFTINNNLYTTFSKKVTYRISIKSLISQKSGLL